MDKKKDVPHSGVKEIIKQPAPSAVASNTDADDFNSSYIEFTPPLPSRYANAGRKSIEEMIKHAEEDRVQLKARDARLEKEKIEPDPDTWYGRFTVFRTVTLQQDVQATPTGSDIERFLTATVRLPTPTKDDNPKASDVQVPTYAWVEKTEKSVIDACILYYDEFEISKHNRMHLEACKIEMLKDGRITKQEKRKRGSTGTRASGRQRTKVKSI